jgi:hypothetical protein
LKENASVFLKKFQKFLQFFQMECMGPLLWTFKGFMGMDNKDFKSSLIDQGSK